MSTPTCKRVFSLGLSFDTLSVLVAEFEKKDKDPEIVEEGGQFFGRPLDFAMDKYNYYMCFKCQKPYFGGERACGAGGGDDYDPTELVCAVGGRGQLVGRDADS